MWLLCPIYSDIQVVVNYRITPFGHPGVNGYVLLTPAFRSLSRPSSPDSSQASAIDLYSLGHIIFSALFLIAPFVCTAIFNQASVPALASSVYFNDVTEDISHHFPSFLRNFKKQRVPKPRLFHTCMPLAYQRKK